MLPRIVQLPREMEEGGEGPLKVILLEEVIERNIHKLFLNYNVICAHPFRIMRNADLSIEEDEAADLLKEIEKQLKKRQWGEVIRLEVESDIDKRLLKIIRKELHMGEQNLYFIDGPLDLTFLMKMYGLEGFEKLKTPGYEPQPVPQLPSGCDIFARIRKGMCCCTIPTRLLRRWWNLFTRRPGIPRCWQSSRLCTGSAAIPPS